MGGHRTRVHAECVFHLLYSYSTYVVCWNNNPMHHWNSANVYMEGSHHTIASLCSFNALHKFKYIFMYLFLSLVSYLLHLQRLTLWLQVRQLLVIWSGLCGLASYLASCRPYLHMYILSERKTLYSSFCPTIHVQWIDSCFYFLCWHPPLHFELTV